MQLTVQPHANCSNRPNQYSQARGTPWTGRGARNVKQTKQSYSRGRVLEPARSPEVIQSTYLARRVSSRTRPYQETHRNEPVRLKKPVQQCRCRLVSPSEENNKVKAASAAACRRVVELNLLLKHLNWCRCMTTVVVITANY